MSGMKISLNAAMRARDVSRPTGADEAAAELAPAGPRPRPVKTEQPGAEQRATPADGQRGRANRVARTAPRHGGRSAQRPAGPNDPDAGRQAGAEVVPPASAGPEPTRSRPGPTPGRIGRPRRRRRSRLGLLASHGRRERGDQAEGSGGNWPVRS
jgi:hypothetical protein